MLESSFANITMLFIILGTCVLFVITWIIKSESKIYACRKEIKKLRAEAETLERDKFLLSEELATQVPAAAEPSAEAVGGKKSPQTKKDQESQRTNQALIMQLMDRNKDFEADNKKLKKELEEAKAYLEEVYKAISSK